MGTCSSTRPADAQAVSNTICPRKKLSSGSFRKHQRSDGLNAFCRILLALELEPWFKARARYNQQLGGQKKGSSNLAEADRLDVRSEIAAAAGVSTGNVSKVKQLASAAHPRGAGSSPGRRGKHP